MAPNLNHFEEEAFDRLVKRVLREQSERFPAPGDRAWRALSARVGIRSHARKRIPRSTLRF